MRTIVSEIGNHHLQLSIIRKWKRSHLFTSLQQIPKMSLSLASTIKLSDGRAIPQLGLGVYLSKGKEGEVAMQHAFKHGYRHLDGAQWYRNEAEMGRAFRASGLSRDEVWITSKVSQRARLSV